MKKISCSLLLREYHCILTKKDNDMSNLHASYTKILSLLHELEPKDNYLNQIRIPKVSDKELIALNLAAESLAIDSERYLFKCLPAFLHTQIERSVYNRRKRNLGFKIEQFRQQIPRHISALDTHHIIDSMPLEVCKLSRSARSKVCADHIEAAPDYGYCAAQKMHYYGYKIHAVCKYPRRVPSL